jgi:hypothetical protein
MTKIRHKKTYVRVILLKNDISNYHQDLKDEQDFTKKLRLFNNCFVALDILRDSFSHFSLLIKNEAELIEKARSLKKRLKFINHLRNRISGHFDEVVLEKAIQWEPQIFSQENRNNEEGKLLLIYKSLIESAINSYVDEKSKQKEFDTEIDLFYPPDQKLFFNYIGEINTDAIAFLTVLENLNNKQIEYWSRDKMFEMAIKAGETDFNLKE